MTNGHIPPVADKQQDWEVTNITENEGMTSMEFYRKKNTSDPDGDNVIGVSSIKLSYNNSDIIIIMILLQHFQRTRGSSSVIN